MIVVPGLSAPNLVSALEANIDAQIPLMYAHSRAFVSWTSLISWV